MKDISYCVSDDTTARICQKINAWIQARQLDGWTVELRIRLDNGQPVAMWQCISHISGKDKCMEFTDCIGMCGREFSMN